MTTTPAPGLLPVDAPGLAAPVGFGPGVLLVDDEVTYLDLLEQLLGEHLSCAVHAFAKPADALVALPSLKIALIITDYNMPGLDGFEFLHEVARTRPELPAVMITAHEVELTPERRRRLPQLKAIIRKPFRWPILANEILQHWPGSRPPFP